MSAIVVQTANKLGVFDELGDGPLDSEELRKRLGLHPRGATVFFDTLVSLRMLRRRDGLYSNAREAGFFLDKTKPSYVGALLEFDSEYLLPSWTKLSSALKTGEPQSGAKESGDLFDIIYENPARLRAFLRAMTGASMGSVKAIAKSFPWRDFETFADIGTAEGVLPVQVVLAHKHLTGVGFDLPVVKPIFEEYVRSFGLESRLRFVEGNFFNDPMVRADVIVMGHILHDWDLEKKRFLIRKAYDSLPKKGALLVYESVLDDQRRWNTGGLLDSLNMLVETKGGFEYTYKECSTWMREAGFRETYCKHLVGPKSMVVGVK